MDFKRKQESTKTVCIEENDERLTMEVAASVSKGALKKVGKAVQSEDEDAMTNFVVSVIKSWDATYDGQPAPIDYEFFENQVPLATLKLIIDAIGEAIAGSINEKKS
jgi:hypothetical protein